MKTEILKSFGSLQSELEQAKNSLKGVDEDIKRLIGRDPSELPHRPGLKRMPPGEDKGRANVNRNRNFPYENEAPQNKRRNTNVSVFKRLSERVIPNDDIHHGVQKQMISKVIVTPKEIPSREEALEAQNKDEKFKARNRRMFGALLGTLQKFQQEETKLKPREEKRAQLEKKIEEHEIKEKEEIKKERQELFLNRKKKQTEIKIIELKMMRMKEYAAWEVSQKPRGNFILTKAEPRLHYLPRRLNEKTKELLVSSKNDVEAVIEKKKSMVCDELNHIEERMKRNFDNKYASKEVRVEEKPPIKEEDDHMDEALPENTQASEGCEVVDPERVPKGPSEIPLASPTEGDNGDVSPQKEEESKVVLNDSDIVMQEVHLNDSVNGCTNDKTSAKDEVSETA